MSDPVVEAKPAATIVLLRDRASLEVLLVERIARGFFGGLMVFPGGGVDECDSSELAMSLITGDGSDQRFRAAALRELAEETSIALTTLGPERAPVGRGDGFYAALEAGARQLDGAGLILISRWVTPYGAPRRYDTRFYLASVTGDPEIRLDESELVSSLWIDPGEALARYEAGEWSMFTPTISHLRWLARRSNVEEAFRSAAGADGRTLIEPAVLADGSIVPIVVPGGDG